MHLVKLFAQLLSTASSGSQEYLLSPEETWIPTASSTYQHDSRKYIVDMLMDGRMDTFWHQRSDSDLRGSWAEIFFGRTVKVGGRLQNLDLQSEIWYTEDRIGDYSDW